MTETYRDELRARFGLDLGLDGEVPDDAWLRRVLLRRTQRRYADRPVPESLVRLLLAAAFSASSKSDFQQASVIWLKDRVRRDRLAALFPDMPWIGAAPVFLVFVGDARRLEKLGELRGHRQSNRTLEGFFNATIDAALALQTCTLAAETLGLGCCPISVLRNRIAEVAEILELPDKVFPVAGLCLGYPAQPGFISMRLPLDATVHIDRYDEAGLPAVVDGYDKRRDARHSIRDRQRAPERFGTADFYGWSEDKARQAMNPEGVGFAAWLRAHGFTFDEPEPAPR
ncbi:MAG: NADPH-dependent oxidoreductase [Alphaproteobacteria bacterium]|nr:MAG: NADPH-dependent oxidoreductase [Alphaproteobacteria bacterium]